MVVMLAPFGDREDGDDRDPGVGCACTPAYARKTACDSEYDYDEKSRSRYESGCFVALRKMSLTIDMARRLCAVERGEAGEKPRKLTVVEAAAESTHRELFRLCVRGLLLLFSRLTVRLLRSPRCPASLSCTARNSRGLTRRLRMTTSPLLQLFLMRLGMARCDEDVGSSLPVDRSTGFSWVWSSGITAKVRRRHECLAWTL